MYLHSVVGCRCLVILTHGQAVKTAKKKNPAGRVVCNKTTLSLNYYLERAHNSWSWSLHPHHPHQVVAHP